MLTLYNLDCCYAICSKKRWWSQYFVVSLQAKINPPTLIAAGVRKLGYVL